MAKKTQLLTIMLLNILIGLALSGRAQIYHFQTIHCRMSDEDSIWLNNRAKFEMKFYNTVFNTAANDSLPVKVTLYGRKGEWVDVQKRYMANATFFAGFYTSTEDKIYAVKGDDFLNVLVHETSHDILHHNYHNPPKWLDEGLAQLFQSMSIQNNQLMLEPDYDKVVQLKNMMYDRTFNLNTFFDYNNADWYVQEKSNKLYVTSYCILYYFAAYDLESLSNVLILMKHGFSTKAAITKIFGSFDKFEKRFTDYYKPTIGFNRNNGF